MTRRQLADLFFFSITALFILIVSTMYCDLQDYNAYYNDYISYSSRGYFSSLEFGYTMLCKLAIALELSFRQFYGILITVILLLIFRFNWKMFRTKFWLLLIFIIYPYINVLQQIRSALGMGIILNALCYLYDPSKKSIKKYLFWVAIATMFHTTSCVYAVFILVFHVSFKRLRTIVITLMLVLPFILLFLRDQAFDFLSTQLHLTRLANDIVKGLVLGKAAIISWMLYFILLCFLLYVTSKRFGDSYSYETMKLVEISLIIIALSSLRFLTDHAYRIAMMALPVVYVTFASIPWENNNRWIKQISYCTVFLFAAVNIFLWWGPLNPDMFRIVTDQMWQVQNYFK